MRIFFSCSIIVCVILCALPATAMQIRKSESCISCHKDTYRRDANLSYVHPSFEDKDCEKCHINPRGEGAGSGSRWSLIALPEVVSLPEYLMEHTLFLRELDRDAVYDIDVISRDMSGGHVITKLKDIVLSKVPNVKTDDRTPPVISGVESGPVTKGIFLESVISWDTDEPATGCVEYGSVPEYGSHTPIDGTLKRHHKASLSALEQGMVYDYRILVEDINGNQSVSTNFRLDTSKIASRVFSSNNDMTETEREIRVEQTDLFVMGSDLGLRVETTRPATVTVEYIKIKESPLATGKKTLSSSGKSRSPAEKKEKLHKPGFRTGKDLCIDLCYECHPPKVLGVSHPVGVRPKRGTRIPEDLPTLEGSVLTCVTCHYGHGSNLRYFARKKPDREICNSCHLEYGR